MGVLVRAAFAHEGPARLLIHRLKYEASPRAAGVLAGFLADLVPGDATAVVPVPRAVARRWRYGVDPARELAAALGARIGVPVVTALAPSVWWARRAGDPSRGRGSPRFRAVCPVPQDAVLVDDVITTGTTLAAAGASVGVMRAITVTSAVRP